MYKQYIKQALHMFRENPLVSSISVAATALSIAVILVMVLVFQINSAGYSPVSNRSRMLFVEGTGVMAKTKGQNNRGSMSSEVVKGLFGSEKAVGKEVVLDFVNYTVCGVTSDASSLETLTYADVWLPMRRVVRMEPAEALRYE